MDKSTKKIEGEYEKRMSKIALVLEGGGMRGIYTSGVLDFFLDQNLRFQNIIGVSAGACNAASYISNQKGRHYNINKTYAKDPRYAGVRTFLRTGSIFGMKFIFEDIPDRLIPFDYDAYMNSNMTLETVVTNARSGQAEYLVAQGKKEINQFIMASSSIPVASKSVLIGADLYYDGGVADSIPVAHALEEGFDKQVIVLTQQRGFVKQRKNLAWFYAVRFPRKKQLRDTLNHRYQVYNESLKLAAKLEEQGKALIIAPSQAPQVGRVEKDLKKIDRIYEMGYQDAQNIKEKLLDFIADGENILQS